MFHVQMRLIELIWTIISPSVEQESRALQVKIPGYNSADAIPLQVVERALLYIQNHKLENPSVA